MAKGKTARGRAEENGGESPAVLSGVVMDPFTTGGEIPEGETPTPPARRNRRRAADKAPAAEGKAAAPRRPGGRGRGKAATAVAEVPGVEVDPGQHEVTEAELTRCGVCGYVRRDPHDCPGPQDNA